MAKELLPIPWGAANGMSSDLDPLSPQNNYYGTDTFNINVVSQVGSDSVRIEPKMGNAYSFELPAVTAHNKKFRIFFESSIFANDTRTLIIYDGNGNEITSSNPISFLTNKPPAQIYQNFKNAINSAGFTIAQTFIIYPFVSTSYETGYCDFEITTIPYWDYSLRDKSNSTSIKQPIVVEEAIDPSLAGQLKFIGSNDLNGDLFLWSTPQTSMPETRAITNITNVNGKVRIFTDVSGIKQNASITIRAANNSYGANGQWICSVNIFGGYIDLLGSTAIGGNGDLGYLTIFEKSVGQIGVAVKNQNDSTWKYYPLLTSKEFNFRTKKQPKCDSERNNINSSIYFTDNFNPPRVFYYKGKYIDNGALNYVNPDNIYDYGNIAEETRLILNSNNFKLNFTGQEQVGGGITAGNWRYCARLLTENLVATPVSEITDAIPVFPNITTNSSNVNANQIGGGSSLSVTTKKNNFLITAIVPNLFKWVELIGIYYQGSVPVGSVIKRELLSQQPEQTIQHVGIGETTTSFDTAELNSVLVDIRTALNLTITENHLVLSNTTTYDAVDFSSWTQTWTHSLEQDTTIEATGLGYAGNCRFGEYAVPLNVYSKMGYMLNEVYRFGAKFKLKSGVITDVFWIDDIRFDCEVNNNIANPVSDRRIKGLASYDLTTNLSSGANGYVKVPYVKFSNIDLTFLIDNIPVRDLIDEIYIERVDISDNPDLRDVLASGVCIKAIGYLSNTYGFTISNGQELDLDWSAGQKGIAEFYAAAAWDGITNHYGVPETYNDFFGDALAKEIVPSYASFYSTDIMYGKDSIKLLPTDKIYNFGSPNRCFQKQVSNLYLVNAPCEYGEYDGSPRISYYQEIDMESFTYVSAGSIYNDGNKSFSKLISFNVGGGGNNYQSYNYPSFVVKCKNGSQFWDNAFFTNIPDYGLCMTQYVRPRGSGVNKYGDIRLSKYIPTGTIVNVNELANNSSITNASIEVFGGDVYTQKTYLCNRAAVTAPHGSYSFTGFSAGFGFYSQNRVNSQMKNSGNTQNINWDFPYQPPQVWLEKANGATMTAPNYNVGYTNKYGVLHTDIAYDETLTRVTHEPTHIAYSDLKPNNSLVDNYRVFLPRNYRDENLSFGEITHQVNFNRHLMTFQPEQFVFQYFNETGVLTTTAGEAVLGNAGIMTRKGEALTQYGTKHGFSVINGKTDGGKDCIAWIDTTHKKVVMHDPSAGTFVISDKGFPYSMRSFFKNYLTYADLYTTPADGQGICGVYDDYNSEFIWTIRGYKKTPEWKANEIYKAGKAVHLKQQPLGTYSTFNQTGEIYVSKTGSVGVEPEITAGWESYWEKVNHNNPEYFNEITIAYSKVRDQWRCQYSFLPKIYLKVGDTYLAPRPVGNENKAYEFFGKGSEYCVWFKDPSAVNSMIEQAENWKISGMVINQDIYTAKHFLAVEMLTKNAPHRMTFKNDKYYTFLDAADFEQRYDYWVAAVKNNVENGVNDGDTSQIFGNFVAVSLEGLPRVYNDMYSFVFKVLKKPRTIAT